MWCGLALAEIPRLVVRHDPGDLPMSRHRPDGRAPVRAREPSRSLRDRGLSGQYVCCIRRPGGPMAGGYSDGWRGPIPWISDPKQ